MKTALTLIAILYAARFAVLLLILLIPDIINFYKPLFNILTTTRKNLKP